VSRLDRARDAIDLVAATVEAPGGVVEHAIFGEDLVDDRTPTRGVVFTEDLVKIAGQQGRYAVGHDRLVLVGEVIVERNAVEIKGGKEVTVYETWPSADGQHDFQGTGQARRIGGVGETLTLEDYLPTLGWSVSVRLSLGFAHEFTLLDFTVPPRSGIVINATSRIHSNLPALG
jgi:hypothetical protein